MPTTTAGDAVARAELETCDRVCGTNEAVSPHDTVDNSTTTSLSSSFLPQAAKGFPRKLFRQVTPHESGTTEACNHDYESLASTSSTPIHEGDTSVDAGLSLELKMCVRTCRVQEAVDRDPAYDPTAVSLPSPPRDPKAVELDMVSSPTDAFDSNENHTTTATTSAGSIAPVITGSDQEELHSSTTGDANELKGTAGYYDVGYHDRSLPTRGAHDDILSADDSSPTTENESHDWYSTAALTATALRGQRGHASPSTCSG